MKYIENKKALGQENVNDLSVRWIFSNVSINRFHRNSNRLVFSNIIYKYIFEAICMTQVILNSWSKVHMKHQFLIKLAKCKKIAVKTEKSEKKSRFICAYIMDTL